MSKYTYEFKLQIVQEYLNKEGGYKYLSEKYGISAYSDLRKWVEAYKVLGNEGLKRSRKNKSYTFEFKLNVVELYLSTEVSYQKLAISVGITNPSQITRWVNDYRIAGPDALKGRRKGRRLNVSKLKKIKHVKKELENTDLEYLKQLEEENLKLKIENAYLKKVRRLRLEEKAQKKKRELFTASENHLN